MNIINCLKSHLGSQQSTSDTGKVSGRGSQGRLPGRAGVCGKPKWEAGHLFETWVLQGAVGDKKNKELGVFFSKKFCFQTVSLGLPSTCIVIMLHRFL